MKKKSLRPLRECLPCPEREAYIQAANKQGLKHSTLRCKNRYIDEFLRFCANEFGHYNIEQINIENIKDFSDYLGKGPHKAITVKTKLREVISWFRWLHEIGSLKENPANKELPPLPIAQHNRKRIAKARILRPLSH